MLKYEVVYAPNNVPGILNVRKLPDLKSKIVGTVAHGQILTANGHVLNGWIPIICNSEQGYIKILWNNRVLLREIGNISDNLTSNNTILENKSVEKPINKNTDLPQNSLNKNIEVDLKKICWNCVKLWHPCSKNMSKNIIF